MLHAALMTSVVDNRCQDSLSLICCCSLCSVLCCFSWLPADNRVWSHTFRYVDPKRVALPFTSGQTRDVSSQHLDKSSLGQPLLCPEEGPCSNCWLQRHPLFKPLLITASLNLPENPRLDHHLAYH